MKAMILAAGLGTRLRPFTLSHPKALFEVNGITLLEQAITYLKKYHYHDIIINVHHFAEQIIEFLRSNNNFGVNITISDESDLLLDTGGAIKKAAWFFDDGKPFLIYNVDIITDLDLNELRTYHLSNSALATLAVRKRKSSRYLLFDENKHLCGWRNVTTSKEIFVRHSPQMKLLAFSGIQILSPGILSYLPEEQVFSLTDFYLKIAAKNIAITYYDHSAGFWRDVGKMSEDNG